MFFASLVLASIQFVAAAIVFAVAKRQLGGGLTIGFFVALLVFLFVPAALVFVSPAALYQAALLTIITTICVWRKARGALFLGGGLVATLIVFGAIGFSGQRSWSAAKERYPFESISERLAYEANATPRASVEGQTNPLLATPVLPDAALARLDEQEQDRHRSWIRRNESLRLVHGSYIEQFITSPGFGVTRIPLPSPYSIEFAEKGRDALHRVERRPDIEGSPEPGTALILSDGEKLLPSSSFKGLLGTLHDESCQEFLDPYTFGYMRDRSHVAGFIPHAFEGRRLPQLRPAKSPGRWLTVRVELVSTLKHARPMVYASNHLPNMSELRSAQVRELDVFEHQALDLLIAGEDLVSDAEPDRIRALGSLRAIKQCLECHEVERGALLGAFSYEFLHDPPLRRLPQRDSAADEKLL
jgi:hypothetical protein